MHTANLPNLLISLYFRVMIYLLLKFVFRITIRVFFRSVKVVNREFIPGKGPMIVTANHPSTFMDPIVVGAQIKPSLHFLAKGAVFHSRFTKWLLPKFNMIPVYRAQDDPSELHKNEDTFRKCHEHLEKKGSILIFPEGKSTEGRKLDKIKTGTARIALGAEAKNNWQLGIKILTAGLNYSDPNKFQSTLLINFDKPIEVKDFKEMYEQDAFKAAHALTELISEKIKKHIIAIESQQLDEFIQNIETVFKWKILKDQGKSSKSVEHDYEVTKAIVDAVKYFLEKEPERLEKFRNEIDLYLNRLERLNLNDKLIGSTLKSGSIIVKSIFTFLYFTAGLPVYLFGVVNNYLPYKIPYWMARKFTNDPQYFGAITMSAGTLTFIIFYVLQLYLLQGWLQDWVITLGYFILLPVSGFFAFFYWKKFTNVRGQWRVLSIFIRRNTLIAELVQQRKKIFEELEKARAEYNLSVGIT